MSLPCPGCGAIGQTETCFEVRLGDDPSGEARGGLSAMWEALGEA